MFLCCLYCLCFDCTIVSSLLLFAVVGEGRFFSLLSPPLCGAFSGRIGRSSTSRTARVFFFFIGRSPVYVRIIIRILTASVALFVFYLYKTVAARFFSLLRFMSVVSPHATVGRGRWERNLAKYQEMFSVRDVTEGLVLRSCIYVSRQQVVTVLVIRGVFWRTSLRSYYKLT